MRKTEHECIKASSSMSNCTPKGTSQYRRQKRISTTEPCLRRNSTSPLHPMPYQPNERLFERYPVFLPHSEEEQENSDPFNLRSSNHDDLGCRFGETERTSSPDLIAMFQQQQCLLENLLSQQQELKQELNVNIKNLMNA